MLSDEGIVILEDELNEVFKKHNDIIRVKFSYNRGVIDGIITYGIFPFEYIEEIENKLEMEGLKINGFYSSGNDLHITLVDSGRYE